MPDENKQWILDSFWEAVRRTRAGHKVTGFRYVKHDRYTETVIVDYINNPGGLKVNVTGDSGILMLKDVIDHMT